MKYLDHALVALVVFATIGSIVVFFVNRNTPDAPIACTMDAMICPDGTALGRTGPNCTFPECPTTITDSTVPDDVEASVDAKADLIRVVAPLPLSTITSPVTITGEARGFWFFEGSFPISVVNWDGLIIGEGIATASGEWMTEDFVPFTATVNFTFDPQTPYNLGALILKKDNPSGLPENDNALEIPVMF